MPQAHVPVASVRRLAGAAIASRRLLPALGALTLCALASGCPSPEPQEKYDAFLEQTKEEREDAANIKMDMGGALADVNGTFLFALSAVIDPTHPLQFFSTVTFTPEGMGGQLAMDLQPLSLDVGSTTTPRQPIGDPLTLAATPVDAGGGFEIVVSEPLMVTGMANPITGSDIVATLTLKGAIQNEDVFCGTVTGMVTQPLMLDLMGSTFAAQRVGGVDMLPQEVLYACPAGGGDTDGGSDTGGSGSSGSSG
jgi:hypothetical protein